MKILVLAPDVPYPANRGGRADIWRRIQAFKALGHHVMLVHLVEPSGPLAPTDEQLAHLRCVVDNHFSFPIRRGPWQTVKKLAWAPWVPWHVGSRVPHTADATPLFQQIAVFAPDLVWLEGPWFGELAMDLQANHGLKLAYRSHNVEHLYLHGQAKAAVSWRNKLAWRLACLGLERYEYALLQRADRVFDISMDDLAFWRERGVADAQWLPPLPETAFCGAPTVSVPSDFLFIGNLRTPNNQLGLRWLIQEVLPRVRERLPTVKLSVVGSMPDPEFRAYLHAAAGVITHFDQADVLPYLYGAKVLLNPVSTGSGVQVKMLDMLSTDAPIVTHPQGLRGLPVEVATLVVAATRAADFAEAAVDQWLAPALDLGGRSRFRERFSKQAVKQALSGVDV
jgi:polysaccharide biosynthesis protein PslH